MSCRDGNRGWREDDPRSKREIRVGTTIAGDSAEDDGDDDGGWAMTGGVLTCVSLTE